MHIYSNTNKKLQINESEQKKKTENHFRLQYKCIHITQYMLISIASIVTECTSHYSSNFMHVCM